jgi:dolichyl-phosphate beta-glucosyltransferase
VPTELRSSCRSSSPRTTKRSASAPSSTRSGPGSADGATWPGRCTGRYRVFLDADGSTPVAEVDRLLAAAGGRDDVVALGSIAVDGAEIDQSQLVIRQWAGRLGNRLIQLLAVPGIWNTQRGCKLFSSRFCREVPPLCSIDGWAFDVELLALSRAAGYELVEVPVRWHHVGGSKVTASTHLEMLADVLRIRCRLHSLRRAGALPAAPGVTSHAGRR